MIELAKFAKEGHWPVGGGIGDQTVKARQAFDFVWREHNAHEQKRKEDIAKALSRGRG